MYTTLQYYSSILYTLYNMYTIQVYTLHYTLYTILYIITNTMIISHKLYITLYTTVFIIQYTLYNIVSCILEEKLRTTEYILRIQLMPIVTDGFLILTFLEQKIHTELLKLQAGYFFTHAKRSIYG